MCVVKLFTLAEANALIPWLERTMTAQRRRLEAIASLVRGVYDLTGPSTRPTLDPVAGESERVGALKLELRASIRALRETTDVLESLGLCVTDMRAGSVDFPAERNGSTIWLCWSPGETSIAWWHTDEACATDRRPLEMAARMH